MLHVHWKKNVTGNIEFIKIVLAVKNAPKAIEVYKGDRIKSYLRSLGSSVGRASDF